MNALEELMRHLDKPGTPDKQGLLRTRALAEDCLRDLGDAQLRHSLLRRFNTAYLVLQFALVADDPEAVGASRRECLDALARIARARAGAGVITEERSEGRAAGPHAPGRDRPVARVTDPAAAPDRAGPDEGAAREMGLA